MTKVLLVCWEVKFHKIKRSVLLVPASSQFAFCALPLRRHYSSMYITPTPSTPQRLTADLRAFFPFYVLLKTVAPCFMMKYIDKRLCYLYKFWCGSVHVLSRELPKPLAILVVFITLLSKRTNTITGIIALNYGANHQKGAGLC